MDPESNIDEYGRDVRDVYGPEYIGDIRGMAGYGQTVGAGRDEEVDPQVEPGDLPALGTKNAEGPLSDLPGQAAFSAMMDNLFGLATQGYVSQDQDLSAAAIQTNPYNNPFTPSAELQATLAAEEAAYAASLGLAPTTETKDTLTELDRSDANLNIAELRTQQEEVNREAERSQTLAAQMAEEIENEYQLSAYADQAAYRGSVNPTTQAQPTTQDERANFTSYITSPDIRNNSYGLTAPSSDPSFLGPTYSSRNETVDPTTDSRAAFTSYVTSPDILNNTYGLTAPSSNLSLLGPAYAGPTGAMVGPAVSDYRNEREVAPTVTSNRSDNRDVQTQPSYTAADVEGRTGNLTGLGRGAVSPGYDISTYGVDPYETVSGAVQTGRDTTGRDGTPYGGGDDTRRPLTAEEIQYLADMGYLTNGAGASTATVNPSTAPVRYDISKFISGIGSLATSGNRT